jgi:hypothetical protein
MLRDVLVALRDKVLRELEQSYQRNEAQLLRLENGTTRTDDDETASLEEQEAELNAAQRLLVSPIARAKAPQNLVNGCVLCWILDGVETVFVAAGRGTDSTDIFRCDRPERQLRHEITVPVGSG